MNVLPEFVTRYPNLAEARLGAKVVSATDDFFAPKERLISRTDPVFIPDKYDDHGKWMDGWESRRKRTPGHDHCVVKLAKPGRLYGVISVIIRSGLIAGCISILMAGWRGFGFTARSKWTGHRSRARSLIWRHWNGAACPWAAMTRILACR